MKVSKLIKYLQEYEINDHGKESEIYFWDDSSECDLELLPQDADEPGIEHDHYMGCGCISGFTLNFKRKE